MMRDTAGKKKLRWNGKAVGKAAVRELIIVLAAIIMAVSLHIFVLPAQFAPGGISGIASVLQAVSAFPAGYSLVIFNAPLYILAFFFLGKRFAFDTLTATLITSLFTELFRLTGVYQYGVGAAGVYNGEHLLAAIAGGVLTGSGIGILVKVGASSGGTDIVSMLIQKRNSSLSVSWLIFVTDAVVALFAGFMYIFVKHMGLTEVISIVLFSFVSLFVSSKTMEIVLNGFTSAVKFEVVTKRAADLSQRIIGDMHRGVTVMNATGAFTNTPNQIVVCVVRKRQIGEFRKLLKEVDPEAFAIAMETREVLGNGFTNSTLR